MKITTNFISRQFISRLGIYAPYLAIGLWLLSGLLILFAIFLGLRVGQLSREAPALKLRLEQFNSQFQGVDAVALPPRDELMAVKQSIAAINKLSGAHNGSLLSVMSRLEAQLPHDIRLVELSYRRRTGEIQMTAEAVRSELVGKLLQDMERAGDYSEVLLVRQSSNQDNHSGRIQFEIQLKERPLKERR